MKSIKMNVRYGGRWAWLALACALALTALGACTDDTVVEEANCLNLNRCGNLCVDIMVDPDNCGGCSLACDNGESCSEGVCQRLCLGGTSLCGNSCADLEVDPKHCGSCDNTCGAGQLCVASTCAPACSTGTVACGDVCADTTKSNDHCGGCNIACAEGEVCSGGGCVLLCGGSGVDCGGVCTNTQTDPNHCGGCGNACPTDQVCKMGGCVLQCVGGTSICNDTCVNLNADATNCGACGVTCDPGEVCNVGSCDLSCGGGSTECFGACVDTSIDPLNCGGCFNQCGGGQNCIAGSCVSIVNCNGATDCGGVCINTSIDSNNCGGCGVSCGVNDYCNQGICVPSFGSCTLFGDTFADNSAGWTLDMEWAIGTATASTGMACGGADPGYDHSPTNSNGVAGVGIGSDATQAVHGFYYLTSPVINTAAAPNLFLEYWRWLVSDMSPAMDNVVEVFDGVSWVPIYTSSAAVADAGWMQQVVNLSAYSNSALQIRFGFQVGSAGVLACPSWSLDDVRLFSTSC